MSRSKSAGVHFSRQVPRLGEESEWPLVPRQDRSNLVAHFGEVRGIHSVEPSRNVQIAPYTLTGMNISEHPNQQGQPSREYQATVGGDLKVKISSNITLDATINPDFGQVEADPAVMDLSAFETFFDEQRPFLSRGIQIYEFDKGRQSDLLYTRRIGAQAPIIGATKLSGRTVGGLSFGVLGATTGSNFSPQRVMG